VSYAFHEIGFIIYQKKKKNLMVPCIAMLQVVCNHLKQMTCYFKHPNNQTGSSSLVGIKMPIESDLKMQMK
jgi:hypothetical protein